MATYNSSTSNSDNITVFELNVYYWEQVLTATIICLIAIIGIVGNSMIIVAVAFSRKLQTSTNAFVTSLGVSDLLTSFFTFWVGVSIFGRDSWPIPGAHWLCVLTAFMSYACRGASMYTLSAISVNRFVLIVKPYLDKKIFSTWKLGVLVTVPWVVPGGSFAVLLIIGLTEIGYDPADKVCSIIESSVNSMEVATAIALVTFPVPLLVTTVCYAWIYVHLKKHFRAKKERLRTIAVAAAATANLARINAAPSATSETTSISLQTTETARGVAATGSASKDVQLQTKRVSHKQIEITKNLFLVVCSIYICFLPYILLIFVPNSLHVLFYMRIVTFANSSINFVIYAIKHPDFKVVFGHMIRRSYADIPQPTRLLRYFLRKRN